ncbi:MAG: hypothetical protein AB7D36_04240 [Oscillospiraceae bacterium]
MNPEDTAESTPSNTDRTLMKNSAKRKTKIIVIALICTVVIATIAIAIALSQNRASQATEVPYNIAWGSAYDQVVSIDSHAKAPALNKTGDNMISSSNLESDYFGMNSNTLDISLKYSFGLNDSLASIMIIVNIDEAGNISDQQFFNEMIGYYNDLCQVEPEEEVATYTWTTETNEIKVDFLSEGIFVISIRPAQ